jgi:DNA-binding IclR family transcriptional regulator
MTRPEAPHKNQAAARVAQVLLAFQQGDGDLGVTEVSALTGLDKSVTHRIMDTLTGYGLLERAPASRRYRIGFRMQQVGQGYRPGRTAETIVIPLLRELADQTGGTGYVGSLDGGEVVYLAVVEGSGPLRVRVAPGGRVPAHATAVGKALLAYQPPEVVAGLTLPAETATTITSAAALRQQLAEVRARGFAVNREEHLAGVGAVSVPVMIDQGLPLFGVSVAFPLVTGSERHYDELPQRLLELTKTVLDRIGAGAGDPT